MSSGTHFSLLGIDASFDIDLKALETGYFQQQRQNHPDRFVGKSAAERQITLQRSADINLAYHVLKNPLKRAQYLLHLEGIAVGTERDSIKPSSQLLMETMEWRQQIDDADAESIGELEQLLKTIYTQSINAISKHYTGKNWQAMAEETLRLGYIIKTQEAATLRRKTL